MGIGTGMEGEEDEEEEMKRGKEGIVKLLHDWKRIGKNTKDGKKRKNKRDRDKNQPGSQETSSKEEDRPTRKK